MVSAPTRSFTIQSLDHVVLRVRDVEHSEAFYRDILGLQVRRKRAGRMVFFTCGVRDHDLAILAVGADAPLPEERRVGLYHFALRVESFDGLRAAYRHFRANDVNIVGITHHGDTKSIYLKDPDSIEIEVFCDAEYDPNGTEASVPAELEAG
jgi:catechol-2,3-dioxygenase